MSEYIGTRSSVQCRSHHLKILRREELHQRKRLMEEPDSESDLVIPKVFSKKEEPIAESHNSGSNRNIHRSQPTKREWEPNSTVKAEATKSNVAELKT